MRRWRLPWRLHERPPELMPIQERPSHVLQIYLVGLGGALVSTGMAVTDVKLVLQRVAIVLGAPNAAVVVFPTAIFVGVPGEEETHFDLSEVGGDGVRFDRAARIFTLVDHTLDGSVSASQGIDELRRIRGEKPRFPVWLRVIGHGLSAASVGMVLEGSSAASLAIIFALGLVVGVFKLLVRPGTSAAILLPTLTAFIIGLASFGAAALGITSQPLAVLVPALVTLLPGGLLTIAVQELAAGDMVAGAGRLVYGVAQLVFLAFGIIAATFFLDTHPSLEMEHSLGAFGYATPWVGIAVMAIGYFLYFCGPRLSFFYLFGILLVAYVVQVLGQSVGGSLGSGFLAAVALTLAAYLVQALPGAPPAVVCFLPAFWLLVPGAAGLIGITQTASGVLTSNGLLTIAGSLVAIALGVLCGVAAYRAVYRVAPARWHLRLA